MPSLIQASLWQQSGRLQNAGPEFRISFFSSYFYFILVSFLLISIYVLIHFILVIVFCILILFLLFVVCYYFSLFLNSLFFIAVNSLFILSFQLMKLEDRKGTKYCLGPTHEEVVTDIVRHFVSSYRQ